MDLSLSFQSNASNAIGPQTCSTMHMIVILHNNVSLYLVVLWGFSKINCLGL